MQAILDFISNYSRNRIQRRYRSQVPSIRRRQKELTGTDTAALTATLRASESPSVVDACANVLVACEQLAGKDFDVLGERRTWRILPFDSQIIGGLVLFNNQVAEMATGEGKTLAAIFAAYLSFLNRRKVHIVTANDYLAERDSVWMGPLYAKLGCTVGLLRRDMRPEERKAAYACDVVYATSATLVYDYLGDNAMIQDASQRVQQGLDYAIVDEADSVLIDDARTPLGISGRKETDLTLFTRLHKPVREVHALQARHIASLITQVGAMLDASTPDREALGRACVLIQQGDPHNEQLAEWLQDSGVRAAMERFQLRVEADGILRAELHNQGFYAISEKDHTVTLSDTCQEQFSRLLGRSLVVPDLSAQITRLEKEGLSTEDRSRRRDELSREVDIISTQLNVIHQLIKAHALYRKDMEYVVQEGRIVLVDTSTGRLLPGRHLSDGLHQSLELKEGLRMTPEAQVLAESSIQNYFRRYKNLGGMTGTAMIDAEEFLTNYKLDVIPIPPHRKCVRKVHEDLHFKAQSAKMNRLMADLSAVHATGRPILVGTASVQESEQVSARLKALGFEHTVLNAKNHAKEAQIVAQAGRRGAITVATAMAGRGTDIVLTEESLALGGLHIIGTTRHYLRRMDEQLKGRCARQGDPGSIQFYISLEDDLLREDKVPVARYMRFFKPDDAGIHHLLVNKVIMRTQAKFSGQYHGMRRSLVSYDNAVLLQRLQIYALRNDILDGEMNVVMLLREHLGELLKEQRPLVEWFRKTFPIGLEGAVPEQVDALVTVFERALTEEIATQGINRARFEQALLLHHLDEAWHDHITALSLLKQGAQLQSYAQGSPVTEFRNKSAKMFIAFTERYREAVFRHVFPSLAQLARIEAEEASRAGHRR